MQLLKELLPSTVYLLPLASCLLPPELTSSVEKFILNSTDFGFVIKGPKLNDTHHLLSIANDEKNFTLSVICYPKLQLLETTVMFKLANGEIRRESIEVPTNGTAKLIVVTFHSVRSGEVKCSLTLYVDCLARGSFTLPFNVSSILSGGQVSIVSVKLIWRIYSIALATVKCGWYYFLSGVSDADADKMFLLSGKVSSRVSYWNVKFSIFHFSTLNCREVTHSTLFTLLYRKNHFGMYLMSLHLKNWYMFSKVIRAHLQWHSRFYWFTDMLRLLVQLNVKVVLKKCELLHIHIIDIHHLMN